MKALLLTYLLSYGGALAAIILPVYGICAYVSLAILKPTRTWNWSVPDAPYSQYVAIAIVAGWVLARFGSWRFGRGRLILVCFTAYIVWSALSMLVAARYDQLALDYLILMLKIFLPFLIAMTLIDSAFKLKLLAWAIILSMSILALEENLYYFSAGHVQGLVGKNGIAHEMALGFGLAVFLGLYSEKWWQKYACWIIAVLLAHVPLIHMSRGAMLGLLVSVVFIVIKMPKNRQTISLSILALIVAMIIVGHSVVEEFSTIFVTEGDRDASAQSRFDLWADMLSVAISNPVFGIGPGHWPTVSAEFGWPIGKQGHGLWIQLCAELGFVGGGFIIAFYGYCIIRLMRYSRCSFHGQTWLLGPIMGVPASLCCWLVEAQFGSFWSMESPYYIALLGAATLRVCSVELSDNRSAENQDADKTGKDLDPDAPRPSLPSRQNEY